MAILKSIGLVHPGWRCELTRRYPKAEINVWAVYSLKKSLTLSIQEIKGVDRTTLDEFLQTRKEVFEYHVMTYSPFKQNYSIVVVKDSQEYITMKILSLGCFPIKPVAIKKGIAEWTVACEDFKKLFLLIDTITRRKSYKLIYIKSPTCLESFKETPLLTRKQYLILREAINNGYYEYPRKTSLNDLAKTFNLSPPTAAKILRAAERKALEFIIRYYNAISNVLLS